MYSFFYSSVSLSLAQTIIHSLIHSLKGYPKILEHFSSVARTVGYHSNKELQYLSKLMRISMQKLENIQLQEGKITHSLLIALTHSLLLP